MITRASTIGELLQNPIGRDLIDRLGLYAGVDIRLINNPIVRGVKLKTLPKLSRGAVSDSLLDTLIELFNACEGEAMPGPSDAHAWWKEAVVYQIYPRSFMDSNGDGVGDLPGILSKLDYLKDLGINAVWLCPVCDSPNDDNGYDVRDYRKIMEEFGSMADMDALIAGLHERGIKVIIDLVLNHTSDEHAWFQESLAHPEGKYGAYYIWQKTGSPDVPPNNWRSFFSGPAWNYYPERGAWAMHLFSKKQMDLNWENPDVRKDVIDLIRFWREKGADGFRLDAISDISKTSLADGDETLGKLLGITGIEHFFYGNRLNEYLHQMRVEGFEDAFTVGETPGTGPMMNKLLTAAEREELSTVFCFDHIDNVGKNRFDDYRYDLNHLKRCFIGYEGPDARTCWPTIFVENHDNPRMVSKVDPRPAYRERVSKLLAALLLTARGTVFLYQGQELGMPNIDFQDISQLRDVESLNRSRELAQQGEGEADIFPKILSGTRDHARTPMQWTDGENGGFTTGTPWIRLGDTSINARDEAADPDSVLNAYRQLIQLRKAHPALVYGDFTCLHEKKKDLFLYERTDGTERFYIEANLTDTDRNSILHPDMRRMELVFGNYPAQGAAQAAVLRPYEVRVYQVNA